MFELAVPWWHIVVRAGVIYFGLFLLIRMIGKRQLGELSPFDFIFLLLISEAVSPALNAGDTSLAAAGLGILTMVVLNYGIVVATARFRRIEQLLEGRPQFLVRQGKVDYAAMRRENISNNDLLAALRENGCMRPKQAEWVVLETSGDISVKKRGD